MEQRNLYDALSGIREDYLTQSEQLSGVSAEFRRARNLKIRTAAVLCCCVLTGITAFALYRSGKNGRKLPAVTDSAADPEAGSTRPAAAEQTDAAPVQTGAGIQPAGTALTGDPETEQGSAAGTDLSGTASAVSAAQTEPTGQQTAATQNTQEQTQPLSGMSFQLFRSTVQPDPSKDAYGEDELQRVVLCADGREYRQADPEGPETLSDFAVFPVSGSVSASALGEYLGRITELGVSDQPLKTPCSKEPSLAGAEVFEYAPAGSRAVLVVRKGTQCSIFLYHGYLIGDGFADAFRFYNSEITAVSYTVRTPAAGGRMQITEEGSVTDAGKIAQIAEVLRSLRMQGPLPQGIGTPQWEADARAAFRENPEGRQREDISIVIRFANGTVMRNMEFQPYIGNGYFSGMEQMTAEQCRTLRALLSP